MSASGLGRQTGSGDPGDQGAATSTPSRIISTSRLVSVRSAPEVAMASIAADQRANQVKLAMRSGQPESVFDRFARCQAVRGMVRGCGLKRCLNVPLDDLSVMPGIQ